MKITQALKAELAHWLDTFWKTYIKGDYDLWATFVADDYYNIGGTKEEIWHSKQEILEYSYAMQDQMVGQAEIRNREIEVQHFGDYLMVNEFTDLFVRIEGEWTFYGPFRMSSLLAKTATGWIALHQHGSYPDMKATKGEAFASDALKAENKRLLEAVDLRTTELLGKNRELAIEAALEKVRAVAMGMKTPDDMLKVCRIIEGQLEVLGIQQIRNVQTAIIEPKEEIYRCYQYFPGYDQDVIERTEYPKNPVEQQMVDQMLATRDSHFLGKLSGEELTEFRMHRKQENHLADPLLEEVEDLGYCFLSIGEGGLGLTLYRSLDEESLSLFKRFHQVFSLTYQRFRDIQKAEAQGRETEIELALERVRARTMAMHNSSELAEASILLDQQVRSLGIQTWGCAFHIYADNEEGDYEWFSSANGSLPFYKTPREKFFLDFYERGQRGEKFHVKEFAGEECKAHYEFLKTIPIAGDSLKALEESGISLPTYQIDHIAFFKHGYVLFITYEPVPEAYEIFQRFAKVFEQTYTRFLDLEKAETQAREAQIETALERVRSRSLAMHATSDLQEVIHAVHQELIKLDIGIFGGSFIVINSEIEKEIHCWGAGGTADTSDEVHIPYFDKPFYTNLVKGLKSGPSFFTEEFTQEEKKEFFTFLFTKEPWSNLKANEKKEILSSPGGYTRSCSVSLHTSIFIINQLGNKFSEKENDILKRFGKVFEQSYTRFLDLQKAEAQAREAQIEVAIERVRAQSMAMHHPDDLDKVNKEILAQLNWLQIEGLTGVTFYLIDEKGWVKAWDFSNPGNTGDQSSYTLQFDSNKHEMLGFPFKTLRQSDLDYFVADYPREKLEKAVYEFEEIDPAIAKIVREALSTGILTHQWTACCRISNGLLGIDLVNPPKKDTEAIVLKMAGAFNQAYTRFLDLQKAEAQAREGQIEAALERVRSRSLAMHHSSELSSVVDTLLQEFTGLDFTLTFCIINLIDEDDLSNTVWAANPETGKDAESYYMKFEDYDFHRAMWDAWKAQDKRFVYVLEGEEKKIYDEYLYSETEFRRFPKHVQEANKSLERYVAGFTFFKYSGLQTVSVNPISEEELAILERFGKVFEQAYIRFLDLQKAEAQAREAQIETALEKVRSRSMGMQKSDELADLSLELVKQVQALGVETWFCAFNIYDENGEESIEWGSNGQSTFPRYKTPRENVFLDYYKAGQRGESLLINEISEEECPSHYEYLCSLPGVGDQLLKMKATGISFPKYQIDHVAFFKYGYILFITYEPVPESHSVFKRFAQVFEQTYTRFLDLQRAEAQTRKSEIEVAVERVRAQSMAMHHPDDLDKVNKELLSQLQWLQIQGLSGVTFYLVEENGWVKAWDFSSPGNIGNQTSYTFQFDSNKHEMLGFPFKILGNTDLDYFIADYPLEKLKKALPELEEIDPAVAEIFTKAIETGALSHQWSACARISSGMLGVDLTAPPSEDTKTIVLKMAGAFNQAYTRFLDLQKAEAQAREAQIESALERVRSRSMAMHNSNEIGDVAMVLFQQLKSLGGELWGTGFAFCEKDSEVDQFWFANENGIMPHLKIPNTVDPAHKQMYEGWKKNLDFLSIENGGKELKNHYKYMLTVPDVQPIFQGILNQGIEFPTWQKWHAAYFKYGYMLVITTETYEDEKVFTRFARVFEQAYTRFLDLQKAEAQAREARIEAALERTRTQSMLMKHSDEIKSISTIFHQQLLELDIPSEFSYVWLPDEPNSEHQFWASWSEEENGKAIYLSKQVTYPLDKSEPYTKACFEAWAQPEVLLEEFISPPEVAGFFEVWQELLEGAEKLKAEYFPEGIFYSEAYMRFGCFGINIRRRLTPEEKSILKRFSIEFERAYTRFLDLKKAEEQAREAQIELAVERVRARALAMYQSGEILEVVHKLKEEIMSLNIPQVAAATIHLKEPDGRCRVWDLTSLELKEEDLHLPLDISFRLDDSHPDFFMRKIWAHTEDYFVVIQKKRDFPHTVQWLKDNGHPEQAEEARIFFDTTQLEQAYHPTVPLKNGRMSLDLLEPPQDEVASILKKMAAAFDLAYKRFEDLQKAESQAKEAKIELSLERIRSQVTSMQESNELFDVVVAMRKEFVSLGHQAHSFWHMKWSSESYDMSMTSEEGDRIGMIISVPKFVHDNIPSLASWEKSDSPVFVLDLDGSQAWDYIENMNKYGHYELADPKSPSEEDILALGGLTFVIARTTHGEIGFSLPGKIPNPPEESLHTLIRFAKVFGIAYKRFEDLQYAEAQAKEAQIELSLERIRSKVTSMQESTDLLDIMVSIRSEFVSLGHEAQYFWYMRWLPSKYEKAMTSGDGAQVGMVMSLPRHIHGDIPLVANWERGNEPTLIFPMDVDTAMDYVQKMVSLGDFEKVDPNAPTMDDIKHIGGLTFIMAKTSQGEIGYSLPGYVPNPPEEAVSTLARFAGVFDLAYKRFEDLKKAEKDLVAIKAAKSKAESALKELKAAQEQLVQQEKLASLGQLTAGIAHEIKNPLNFVNNFSELSKELIEEVFEELEKLDPSDIKQDIFELLTDVQSNLTKVHEHGSRADGIVKSMLQHSRGSAGKTSAIRVNEFVKEFSNLAFHGMRAGKNPININLDFDLDENAGEVTLVMEDFSRVILNIANNAFDAMRDKLNSSKNGDYLPCLKIKTKRLKNKVLISIQDNGPGIPKEIKDKILQPFFTTKKGTEGTGLGLSITHDIVKAHRGEIKIESKPGDGASFLISLPIS